MNVTSKGRYALMVMIDLAQHPDDGFISLKTIAYRQGISMKYLEMIVGSLKKAELVADHACPAQTKRYIFMKEREVQAELHRQEREAKLKTRAIKNKMRVQKNTETQGSPGQVERK